MDFILIIKSFYKRQFKNREFIYGLVIAVVLYLLLFLDYYFSTSAYGLGAYFLFPFIMIWIPFLIAFILRFSKKGTLRQISRSIIVSIVFSGLFIFSFQKVTFYILDFLAIPKRW
ncbi:hypothetical protein Q766_13600 [Flavobacterium subsaxonicum WB 4.1-42 = DSM 21790]|uniref:Uncharacterized protein n=1 Tax=Flavobacterium subsaxonicum WB 4.1-42 = DSM 21790 TaxID=1121898 RepID=A0A0A2MHU6_9FLAO|nr:hypothetical protein Q766_13600 [Flavobacterium subsaxonicum WB 4.1-42 = DSM 21790]